MAFSSSVIVAAGGRRGAAGAASFFWHPPATSRHPEEQGANALAIHLVSIAFPPGSPRGPRGLDTPNVRCYPRALGEANRHGTIGRARRAAMAAGGEVRERVAVPRRGRARRGGAAAWAASGRRRRLDPPHPPRAAARAPGPPMVVFVPGHPRQPAAAARRHRGLAQPRQHARPPRPLAAAHSCRSRRSRDDLAPRLPDRDRHRPAARVRLHRVRRLPRPPRLRGLRARASARACATPSTPTTGGATSSRARAASRCGSRGSRARWATPARASTSSGHSMGGLVARYYLRYGGAEPAAGRARDAGPARRRMASLVLAATPNAGSIPALGAILSGERVGLSLHDARRVGREPDAVRLPAAAARGHAARSSTRAGKPLDRRPARPRHLGALRLGAVRARRSDDRLAAERAFLRRRPRAGARLPRRPRARARRRPAPCPCTRSAATACSPSPARWSARARRARRRGSRRARRREQDLLYEAGDGRVTRASLLATHLPGGRGLGVRAAASPRSPHVVLRRAPTTTGSTPTRRSRACCCGSCCGPRPAALLAAVRPERRTRSERRDRASPHELRAVIDTLRQRDQQYRLLAEQAADGVLLVGRRRPGRGREPGRGGAARPAARGRSCKLSLADAGRGRQGRRQRGAALLVAAARGSA